MRQIKKGTPPQEFVDFVKKKKPKDWDCIHLPENQKVYTICKDRLLQEQHCLSGYTERVLKNNIHIDHFKKKDLFPKLTFVWENLILDEHNSNYGADFKDSNVKKDDYSFLINPNVENPHEYFTYQLNDGKIIPIKSLSEKCRKKAEFTIKLFNLNSSSLVQQRLDLINMITIFCKDAALDKKDIYMALKNKGFPSVVEFVLNCY